MARLKDFIRYLKDRHKTVGAVEHQLCELQEKFETYFQEVSRVREEELAQLTEHILADRAALPAELNTALDLAQQEQEQQLEVKLKRLRNEHQDLLRRAEHKRSRSRGEEERVHSQNKNLDRQEEELKERNAALLAEIEAYNQRIRQLGRGWGFFANLFRMRHITAERRALDQEQSDVAARIDILRGLWREADLGHVEKEAEIQERWVELNTEAAALAAKIGYLEQARGQVILRSTVEQVLFERTPELPEPSEDDPACPRCKTKNPTAGHFCRICAARLKEDRPDLSGSILEIAELNQHHGRFSEGMQACQQLIGLVRGLRSGIAAFMSSVEEVKASEDKYPLPKLNIDVPNSSKVYGERFDALRDEVKKPLALHPQVFAASVQRYVDEVFTEKNIKAYFERMGEELSRQADSQW